MVLPEKSCPFLAAPFYSHKSSYFQPLQNPIAVMSIEGNLSNRLATFSLKLLFGETDARKYLIIHNR